MCGIAGHISFAQSPDPQLLQEVVDRMRHRGPDDSGLWVSPDASCVLGQARLSIIDLSPLGHQPMFDPETGNCITFNGEIFNFPELRKACEQKGERFRSHSDTEIILVLYRLYGIECLQMLRGMFAFAIWDAAKEELFIARDRVGKKPFNYYTNGTELIFCSEIDPLVQHPSISKETDAAALELYLQQQAVPSPRTIYKQIRKLPPAHYGVFRKNGFHIQKYWEVDYRNKKQVTEEQAIDELEEQLTEAVRLRMISDVPLGALLSGGVDSSVIVALMAKLSGDKVRTFSVGFKDEAFNELPYAQQAADIAGTIHHPEIAGGTVTDLLPLIIKHYGEPYADSSAVPSFMVAQSARKHVTVVMNGDGGDELLGGYHRYAYTPFQMKVSPLLGKLIPDELAAEKSVEWLGYKRSAPVKLARTLLKDYARPELESLGMYDNFFNDRLRKRLLGNKHDASLLPNWRKEWLQQASAHATHPYERMLWYDTHTYLPDDLLVKMDIAAMHTGLEARSPLLDHKLIEYCATLEPGLKSKNGVTKYLLKKLAERYFPKEFVYRKKMGFGIPLAEWLRGPLREMVVDTLTSSQLMQPLNKEMIEKILNDFMKGEDGYKSRIWVLLMYGMWQDRYYKEIVK